ncbi:hypothetical protein ALO73_103274, partial [Pseudomonas syringae pv. daphniphylli]
MLGNQDRGEATIAVSGDIQAKRPVVGQNRLAAFAITLIGRLLRALRALRVTKVVTQLGAERTLDQSLLERHGRVLNGFGAHRAFNKLLDQLLGNRGQLPRCCIGGLLFGRHTCTSSYMLCPNTKFLTVS